MDWRFTLGCRRKNQPPKSLIFLKKDFRFDILLAQDNWLKEKLFFTITVPERKIKVLHPKGIIKMKLLALRE